MKIQVLGSGCHTCKTLHEKVQDAVKKLGMKIEVEYSTDITEIVKLGAMSSPVFAIDGEIITSGKVPANDEIEKLLKEKCPSEKSATSGSCSCSCSGNC